MVRTKIIYRLIVMFLVFAAMITIPLTFTVITQVNKMIAEEEAMRPPSDREYENMHHVFSSRLLGQIIPYSFYILIMALMLSIFLSRKMLISLKELQRGAKSIREGNLDVVLRISGDDELAAVTRAFNEMAASLKEKTLDLQKKNTYVDAMLDPLWVVDEMNRVADVNPAFVRLFGYSREEVIGASVYDFFDEQNVGIIRNQLLERTERKIASTYEVSIITREGTSMPVLLSGSPILEEGRVSGKIGIFKDFREQQGFRREVEQSRDYVETVVNSIEDQLLVIDKEYRIVTANRRALEHVSGSPVGQYCYLVSHDMNKPCWADGHECPAQSVFLTGKNFRTTHQHTGSGGERRFHEIVATPIRDAAGNVSQVIELIRDVTDRISHEEEIFRKNRELVALNSISGLLSRSLRADEIFMNVLDRMIEMIKMDGGGIFFIDELKRDMVCQYHRGISEEYIRMMGRIRMGEDIPGKVAVTGQIMTTSDISKDTRIERSLMKHSGMKGYCCLPVRGKERIIGVFCLFSFKPHYFTEEEESILNSIGEMTGIALENIKLYEKMRDMYEQQRKRRDDEHGQLLALTTKLGSAVDLRYVIGSVLELIRNMFNADFSWLLVRDSGDNYRLRASSSSTDLEDRMLYPRGVSSLEGYTADKRTPTVIADIRAGSRFYVPDEIGSLGYQSALAVPMHIGEKTVGVFTLYYRRTRDFRDEELHFLRIIANMLAVSLERYDSYVRSISEKGIATTIIQSVVDGIVTVDTQGRIIAINRAFEEMTAMSADEAVGLTVCDALRYTRENLDLRIAFGECLESALSGESINRGVLMTTAAGAQLSVLITGTPVLDAGGAVTGVVCLIRDISREKEIDRMKTDIIRSVSHEFRTPLSAIVGMTEMILEGDLDAQKDKLYLQTILSEGMRLSDMVSDLLSIARIESGMETLRPEVLDVAAIFEELQVSLESSCKKKNASIRCEVQGIKTFTADGSKLKQVLLNVIDNSLMYSDSGCLVAVTAKKSDNGIVITVKDNGWGISAEDMPHLKERFYRGRHGEKIKGTGLGLFLCNEIIRLHGGTMDIRSTFGTGTEVTLYLPDRGTL
ncbi:MAG: hypothetical protein C0402_08540 [Thermodesulfovibrio sp.]|nr:hypothetical protein [Thermodesulfovibrio sp.]